MEMTAAEGVCKRYRIVLLAVGIFCIADVAVHYWSSSVHIVSPTSLAPLELVPESPPIAYPYIVEEPEMNVTKRLTKRLSHYHDVCLTSKNSIHQDMDKVENSEIYVKYYIKQQRVVVDRSSKFAVCLQAKGGSSFWKHLFHHKDISKDGEISYSVKSSNAARSMQFISLPAFIKQVKDLETQNYTLFVFGRNPWNRLVSLYRQKIEGVNHNHSTYKYVKAACQQYPCDTFQQLLECVLYTWSKGFPDRHWEPLTVHCGLCKAPYNYIGHTEFMNEETTRMLTTAGVKGNVSEFLQTIRLNSIREVEEKSVHVDYKSYYRDIPDDIIQRLKDMYKHDITLLGYNNSPF